jgi:hypothetical protein
VSEDSTILSGANQNKEHGRIVRAVYYILQIVHVGKKVFHRILPQLIRQIRII